LCPGALGTVSGGRATATDPSEAYVHCGSAQMGNVNSSIHEGTSRGCVAFAEQRHEHMYGARRSFIHQGCNFPRPRKHPFDGVPMRVDARARSHQTIRRDSAFDKKIRSRSRAQRHGRKNVQRRKRFHVTAREFFGDFSNLGGFLVC
jgi:hypothetical protein